MRRTLPLGLALCALVLAGCAFWRGLTGAERLDTDSAGGYEAGQALAEVARAVAPPPIAQAIAVALGLAAAVENGRQRTRRKERDAMIRAVQDVKTALGGEEAHELAEAIRKRAGESGVVATLHEAYKKLFPKPAGE